ncbi:hypothetical protein DIPPA_05794 [Diplonema papillatum]|nr:hypothetical protein DIPPA_05794 [Diplonema papillatum]
MLVRLPVGALAGQRRRVLSVPAHIMRNKQRMQEYKIARMRCCTSLKEQREVISHYRAEGILDYAECNVMVHGAALERNIDHGSWIVAVMRRSLGRFSVFEYNNLIYLYHSCGKPDLALKAYVEMIKDGVQPTSDTYTLILRMCSACVRHAAAEGSHRNYYRIAAAVIDIITTYDLVDGRWHLIKGLREWYVTTGDKERASKCTAMLANTSSISLNSTFPMSMF